MMQGNVNVRVIPVLDFMMPEKDSLGAASPFFIVADIDASLAHYCDLLGFECRFKTPNQKPFFAIVGRGAAQLMIKAPEQDTPALPNNKRHDWVPWDAFIYAPDPDALAQEFVGRNAPFHQPLADTDDHLRGFEIADPDGYVCFFGRPT